jgi:hypothetical protein
VSSDSDEQVGSSSQSTEDEMEGVVDGEENVEHEEEDVRDYDDKEDEEEDVLDENTEGEEEEEESDVLLKNILIILFLTFIPIC